MAICLLLECDYEGCKFVMHGNAVLSTQGKLRKAAKTAAGWVRGKNKRTGFLGDYCQHHAGEVKQ